MSQAIELAPAPGNLCFGCGGANDEGMKLTFVQDNQAQRIRGSFRLGPRYQGGGGMIHGGIIALVLDEVMGKVSRFSAERAVTAELKVEYLKPISVDQEIFVEGWQEGREARNRLNVGEIRNAEGVVLARGTARFVVLRPRA